MSPTGSLMDLVLVSSSEYETETPDGQHLINLSPHPNLHLTTERDHMKTPGIHANQITCIPPFKEMSPDDSQLRRTASAPYHDSSPETR